MMMICCLQTLLLLGAPLVLSGRVLTAPTAPNNFFYHNFLSRNGSKQIHFSGVKLHVDSAQASVFAVRGGNVTLPCRFWYEPELSSPREVRIKWSWVPAAGGHETDVLLAISPHSRSFGEFRGRVQLRQDFPGDAALLMTELQLNDTGRYHCEVVDGLEDKSVSIDLELRGVVFPYQHPHGRYHLSFQGAQQVCEKQDSTLATFTQLFQSWKEGLNWCNAGWLADGTVQYPITQPRVPCGGHGLAPGVRSYGRRHLHLHRYDVFCFSSLRGRVYYLQPSHKMNLTEAEQACERDGAEIAKVGQLYAAWKFTGLDNCDAGWLADGSVRYAITRPRQNCGPSEPGVRSFGFPPPQHKHGVYCYKSDYE
ncbi:hyaluronan and proteoglycan link protein 3-like [Seriola lalandi dorsalis]|uniref:Hyaluronan and proteoglycan link protein 3 n=2 Tax=Seriola lalandi dorsalis TaxID=1841481 RepID=A0A3B4X9V2_SERLL|nr:hyaluronan and proteoglycan link protein 3-like [Seriola lalandi dorsalis]XP_023270400.1 hyaluronan and proteoglycan link protein 3-like [Seriola lalandi dorsalis]